MFEKIDLDGNNNISQAELKELIADIKFGKIPGDVDESVVKLIEELDTSGDKMISEEEFVTGLTKWINKSNGTQPPSSSHESEDDIYQVSNGKNYKGNGLKTILLGIRDTPFYM